MKERKRRLQCLALPLAAGILLCSPVAAANGTTVATAQESVAQQTIQVTGIVKDDAGEPLIGVSVYNAANRKQGTTTDIDGRYTLSVPASGKLTFSYVGFKTTTVDVSGRTHLDISLEPNSESLDELVVVGYGVVRKADLAGSVSVLDNKQFSAQPITQVSDALQGRVSGVNIVSDGLPGGTVRIRIRGANSINKSNDPLYVVDGLVRESGLDGINPEDIASMQILKDASSTAIYGSRGANGVVIITTKHGNAGETKVVLDASFGLSQATNLPSTIGTKEYARYLVDFGGQSATTLQPYLDGTNPGIDWKDEMFRTGTVQNYKVVVTKGSEKTQLYVSGAYMRHDGIIRESSYQRYSARASVSSQIYDWFNLSVDVNASHGVGKGIGGLSLGGYNPLWIGYNSSPTMEMMDANGVYNRDPYCTIQNNAVGVLKAPSERRRDVLNGHVDLRFNICPGLTFTSSNGLDYNNYQGYWFTSTKESSTTTSAASNSNNNRWLIQSSNNLTYINTFNEKHNLTATAVWEATRYTARGLNLKGVNFPTEVVGWWNLGSAGSFDKTDGATGNSYSEWSLLSAVARAIYNYDNRYMLTGTFRADGSSKLPNHKWSYFPSIAAAWTMSNERFFEPIKPVLTTAKLRASFGVIGNQDINPFETLALMSQTTTSYGSANGLTGFWANQVGAPDLKWEKTKQVDVGLDLSFLNERIDVSLDWYYKRTSDALLKTTLADYLGGSSYWVNAGNVRNTGFDMSITANILQNANGWNWSTTINGSYLKNKVTRMTEQVPVLYSGSMQSIVEDACVVMEGQPIGALYGYQWAGIDADGYDTYYAADGSVTRSPQSTDRVILGKSNPTFTLGWNNTVNWKNWSLNMFFNGAFGAKRINALRYAMNTMTGNSRFITSPDGFNGIGTTMPDPRVDNNFAIGNSSKWVESADYFRLENITLSYDLLKSVTKFADIRLSFSIQNLFTITSYKGGNPASFSFSDSYAWAQGVDTGTSPTPRTYTFGARFTF